MVKTRHETKYDCEWPGCDKSYDTYTEAEKCEKQGSIGPNITPRLILRGGSRDYIVVRSSQVEGHYNTHKIIHFLLNEASEIRPIKNNRETSSRDLGEKLCKSELNVLSQEEFEKINGPVQKIYSHYLEGIELYRTPGFIQDKKNANPL